MKPISPLKNIARWVLLILLVFGFISLACSIWGGGGGGSGGNLLTEAVQTQQQAVWQTAIPQAVNTFSPAQKCYLTQQVDTSMKCP